MEMDPQLRDQLRRLSAQEFAAEHRGLFVGVSLTAADAGGDEPAFNTLVGDVETEGGNESVMLAPLAKRAGANSYSFITVGRSSNNDIVIRVGGVSKCHVVFNQTGDDVTITDANSSYGTTLNGRAIAPNQPVAIQVGDLVSLANRVTLMLFDAASAHSWFRLSNR